MAVKRTKRKPQRKAGKKGLPAAVKKKPGLSARRELLIAAAARLAAPIRRKAARAVAMADAGVKTLRLRDEAEPLSALPTMRKPAAVTHRRAGAVRRPAKKKATRPARRAPVTPRRRRAATPVPPPAAPPLDRPIEIPQWAWAPPAKLDARPAMPAKPGKKRKVKKSPRRRKADFLARQRAARLAAGGARRRKKRPAVDRDGTGDIVVSGKSGRRGSAITARTRRGSQSRARSVMGLWSRARIARVAAPAAREKNALPARRPAAARPVPKAKAQRRAAARPLAARRKIGAAPRPARVARPMTASKPLPPPKKKIYLDYGPPLPERYHADWMFAMVRDPEWVYVYWEMSDGRLPALRRRYGAAAVARGSWRLVGRATAGKMLFSTALTAGETGNWYCKVGARRTLRFFLVLRLPDGRAVEVLASNVVHTPRLWPSERTDAAWYVSEEKFVGRYIRDYEPPYTSGQGRSFPGFTIPVPANLPGSGRPAAAREQAAPEEEYRFPEFYWPDLPTSGKLGRAGESGFYRRENLPTSGRMGR